MMAEVFAVNRYRVHDAPAYDAAVSALVARVRDAGHPGVLTYQFHRATPQEGRALVRYADAEAWVGHHDLIMGWPEMAAFRACADLEEVLLFGLVTPAMQAWVDRMDLGPRLRRMGLPLSGFSRG